MQLITDVSTLHDDDEDGCHEDLSTDHVAALLTYENFHINGKMNLFFFSLCLTILLMELADCTILIGKDNDAGPRGLVDKRVDLIH